MQQERTEVAVLGRSLLEGQAVVLAMERSHGVCCRLAPGVERVVLCTFALHSVVGLRRGSTGPSSLPCNTPMTRILPAAGRASNLNRPWPSSAIVPRTCSNISTPLSPYPFRGIKTTRERAIATRALFPHCSATTMRDFPLEP